MVQLGSGPSFPTEAFQFYGIDGPMAGNLDGNPSVQLGITRFPNDSKGPFADHIVELELTEPHVGPVGINGFHVVG